MKGTKDIEHLARLCACMWGARDHIPVHDAERHERLAMMHADLDDPTCHTAAKATKKYVTHDLLHDAVNKK